MLPLLVSDTDQLYVPLPPLAENWTVELFVESEAEAGEIFSAGAVTGGEIVAEAIMLPEKLGSIQVASMVEVAPETVAEPLVLEPTVSVDKVPAMLTELPAVVLPLRLNDAAPPFWAEILPDHVRPALS